MITTIPDHIVNDPAVQRATLTQDEINIIIGNRVDLEMPEPEGGFAYYEDLWEYNRKWNARFDKLLKEYQQGKV